jgi:sugar phosphate isomerase/epimerase
MLRVLSTHLFLNQRLHPGLLDLASRAGAQAVEIFAARQHFDYTSREHVAELAAWFRSNSLKAFSMHAPMFPDREMGRAGAPAVNVLHPDKARRIDAMDEIKRALETAEHIPLRHLVVHLGERTDTWSPRSVEYAQTALEHLGAFAHPLGVSLLVENILNEPTTPEHLLLILQMGHLNGVGVCLDLGHAHISPGIAEAIGILVDASSPFIPTTITAQEMSISGPATAPSTGRPPSSPSRRWPSRRPSCWRSRTTPPKCRPPSPRASSRPMPVSPERRPECARLKTSGVQPGRIPNAAPLDYFSSPQIFCRSFCFPQRTRMHITAISALQSARSSFIAQCALQSTAIKRTTHSRASRADR